MKLDARQTRRLLLAGAVPFPKPFPSIGRISIERGRLVFSKAVRQWTSFVVVQDNCEPSTTRLILRNGVAGIFFPGVWVSVPRRGKVFRFSQAHAAYDLERGEWFLGREINVKAIRERLRNPHLAIDKRRSPARGIVFVYRDRPVMTITEIVQTAGSIRDHMTAVYCCDPTHHPEEPCCDPIYCCDPRVCCDCCDCWEGCDCHTHEPPQANWDCDCCNY